MQIRVWRLTVWVRDKFSRETSGFRGRRSFWDGVHEGPKSTTWWFWGLAWNWRHF